MALYQVQQSFCKYPQCRKVYNNKETAQQQGQKFAQTWFLFS